MIYFFYLFVFLFGLAVGSFLNVVIHRLTADHPENSSLPGWQRTVLCGRSHCPKCGQTLRWYDLIPVLSFFILRGRCRYCSQKISWQYPSVEIATALLFLLISNFQFPISNEISNFKFQISNAVNLGFLFFIISCLFVIFVYDLRHYIIPDKVLFPAIGISILYRLSEVFFRHAELVSASQEILKQVQDDRINGALAIWRPFLLTMAAALAAAAFFLALVLITRGRGMGLGDVKLAFLMGLILGWPNILVALLLAFSSGALVGLSLIVAKRKTLKSQIPFGPFLIGGTLITFFFGSAIINWYFSFFL
ncbi:MAG: leader peptidase (prepilin peptidase) / N-methyltransferase [Parcubacteria group bacterium LiPW_39]|nr:MAG: leader peptidase (prepilin peptidase) / N-methyltransferase [Parcubacteria group bacterium LiPW_39]